VNDAEVMRSALAASREAGVDFDAAWTAALATLLAVEGHPSSAVARERRAWLHALRWARSAFEDAYLREPDHRGASAASDFEPLLAV